VGELKKGDHLQMACFVAAEEVQIPAKIGIGAAASTGTLL